MAQVASTVEYSYNSIGKRDPFRSPNHDSATSRENQSASASAAAAECDDPLCMSDVDDFAVVAVVSGDANPLAMVEDRSGVGHLVRRNTRIGRQGGKVTQVLRDCIVVTSFVSGGGDGKPQANKQTLCVKSDLRTTPPIDLFKNKEFIP